MQNKLSKSHWSTFFAFCAGLFLSIAAQTVQAQDEAIPASQSSLTGINLPTGAMRVREQSVPPEINQSLEKLLSGGEGKLRQGQAEVLAWAGPKGWTYETGGKEGEVTVFSAVRANPTRRAVLGFFVPTDDALVVAWTEVIAAGGSSNSAVASKPVPAEKPTAKSAANANALFGTWNTGGMSMMADRNRITGATTPSNGSTFKYVFTPDGRFEFIGMMQSTLYGCTTTLFNDKRGSFEMNGSTVTLIPNKNFWRQQNSCAPNSTKEKNHTLANETFQLRTKTDEYGKPYICLADAKGETCYRRAEN